jgi:hypothetical protein
VGTTVPLDELDPPDALEAIDKPDVRGLMEPLASRSRWSGVSSMLLVVETRGELAGEIGVAGVSNSLARQDELADSMLRLASEPMLLARLSSGGVNSPPPPISEREVWLEGGCSVNVGALYIGDVTSWGDSLAVPAMFEEEFVRCSMVGFVGMLVEELLRLIPDERVEDWRLVSEGTSVELDVRTSPPLEGGLGRGATTWAKSPPSIFLSSSSVLHDPDSNLSPLPRKELEGATIMAPIPVGGTI